MLEHGPPLETADLAGQRSGFTSHALKPQCGAGVVRQVEALLCLVCIEAGAYTPVIVAAFVAGVAR